MWRIYARVYDSVLLGLIPYHKMLDRVVWSLGVRSGERYLDAGCGTGNLLRLLAGDSLETRVDGVDFSAAMLNRAREKLANGTGRVGLHRLDLERVLPFAPETFSGVACVNVLYAVNKPESLVRELARVLEVGGRLVLVTPLRKPRIIPIVMEHLAALKKVRPRKWVPAFAGQVVGTLAPMLLFMPINLYITRRKDYFFFSEDEIQSLLTAAGFRIWQTASVYGRQNLFVVAEKAGLDGKKPDILGWCEDA